MQDQLGGAGVKQAKRRGRAQNEKKRASPARSILIVPKGTRKASFSKCKDSRWETKVRKCRAGRVVTLVPLSEAERSHLGNLLVNRRVVG
jgi:hypothetical protein